MQDTPQAKGLVLFIKKLSCKYKQEFESSEKLKELKDRLDFCLIELAFWIDRNDQDRYEKSLRSLASWILSKLPKKNRHE